MLVFVSGKWCVSRQKWHRDNALPKVCAVHSGLQLCCREGDCESYHDNGIGNRVEELPQSVRVCKKVYRLREVEGDKRITKRIGKITDAIPARYTYADCISARV